MKELNQFYNDENTRNAVYTFLLAELDNYALKQMYKGGDVSGMKNAKEFLLQSFETLRQDYEPKKEAKTQKNRAV
jgi:hypothetical protein